MSRSDGIIPRGDQPGSGRFRRLFGFAEPSRRGLRSFLMVRDSLTGPSDEAIGAHEQSAQTQPIPGVTCDIGDPTAPAACERLKRGASVKVQQQAFPLPEEFAELR